MPAITSLDLSNAKLDVDHIADIATSLQFTATDRLGHIKDTISGAVYKISSFTNKGVWAPSTNYQVKDLVSVTVSSALTWYVCVIPHTSSVAFSTDSSSKWRVYQGITTGDLSADTGATLVGTSDGVLQDVLTNFSNDLLESTGELSDQVNFVGARLFAGTSVVADCFGDSTMWGADPSNLGAQVSTTSPQALQNFVNLYYGNSSFTVNNRAISGTTATQMIAGTDGSGTTFEVKMSSSSSSVVYCNHGVNDATGTSQTSITDYKKALVTFVTICRKYNKTPILVTPFINFSYGTLGSYPRSERIKYFAQAVRDVAKSYGVTLVDNYSSIEKLVASGKYKPLDLLPDAVHANQAVYFKMGHNLAAPLVGQMTALGVDQFQVSTEGYTLASNQAVQLAPASRFGAVALTPDIGTQSLRMLVDIKEPGSDLYLAHPIYQFGHASVPVSIDGTFVATLSMNSTGFLTGTNIIQDYEVKIASNIDVGIHIVHMSVSSGGGLGSYYLRTRPTSSLSQASNGPSTYKRLLCQELSMAGGGVNNITLVDKLPSSRLIEDLHVEFTGQMVKTSGFLLNSFSYGTGPRLHQGVMLSFNDAGYPTLYEATAPDMFSITTIVSTDYTTASKKWRIKITKAGTGSGFGVFSLFADDVQVGSSINLTKPYYGGFMGLWNYDPNNSLRVSDISQVYTT